MLWPLFVQYWEKLGNFLLYHLVTLIRCLFFIYFWSFFNHQKAILAWPVLAKFHHIGNFYKNLWHFWRFFKTCLGKFWLLQIAKYKTNNLPSGNTVHLGCQFPARGFKPTTYWTWVSTHNYYTRASRDWSYKDSTA